MFHCAGELLINFQRTIDELVNKIIDFLLKINFHQKGASCN